MKIIDYVIVYKLRLDAVGAEVRRLIKDGYEPYGHLVVIGTNVHEYAQVMVKVERPPAPAMPYPYYPQSPLPNPIPTGPMDPIPPYGPMDPVPVYPSTPINPISPWITTSHEPSKNPPNS